MAGEKAGPFCTPEGGRFGEQQSLSGGQDELPEVTKRKTRSPGLERWWETERKELL